VSTSTSLGTCLCALLIGHSSIVNGSPRSWKLLHSLAAGDGNQVAAVSRSGLHGYNSSGWKNHLTGVSLVGAGTSIWRSLSSRCSLILSSSLNLCCSRAMEKVKPPSLLSSPIVADDDSCESTIGSGTTPVAVSVLFGCFATRCLVV
jgi:hypothetical protein